MKQNHILIGLGVATVIVAIWAALRNTGVSPTVVVQSSPSLQPIYGVQGVTPLGAPAIVSTPAAAASVASNLAPTPTQAQVPAASASGVPNYTAQTQLTAGGAPIPAPNPTSSVPKFYGPIQQFLAQMVPITDYSSPAPKSSCGCGGGCAGSCKDPCASTNSRFPDGRGACLAFNRKTQIAAMSPTVFMRASENIKSANIDPFDVFQVTAFDNEKNHYTPASPFLSPV